MLGLYFCARAFSSCGEQGPLFIAVHGPLTVAASLVAEHKPQTRRLSSCGSRAHLLRGMWDLPRPGLEPVSPALAGRLSTTAPPGNPLFAFLTKLSAEHIIGGQAIIVHWQYRFTWNPRQRKAEIILCRAWSHLLLGYSSLQLTFFKPFWLGAGLNGQAYTVPNNHINSNLFSVNTYWNE